MGIEQVRACQDELGLKSVRGNSIMLDINEG